MGIILAFTIVLGMTTVFATSGLAGNSNKENTNSDNYTDNIVDLKNIYMTDESDEGTNQNHEVEWWTYDAYKEWLEEEKKTLQDMIGERTWDETRLDSYNPEDIATSQMKQ